MGKKIKYLGSSTVRRLEKGEDWGGRLAAPLETAVVFGDANRQLIDTDEAGLSDEAVELLLEDPDFKDVTDAKRIPSSLHEKMFLGHGATIRLPESDDPDFDSTVRQLVQDKEEADAEAAVGEPGGVPHDAAGEGAVPAPTGRGRSRST